MLNAEKFKKEIEDLNYDIAMVNEELVSCICPRLCCNCDWSAFKTNNNCSYNHTKWLLSEYKEPPVDWNKIVIDTKVLVSYDGKHWYKRYFAKYENFEVYCWTDGMTSWNHLSEPYSTENWKYAKLAEEE